MELNLDSLNLEILLLENKELKNKIKKLEDENERIKNEFIIYKRNVSKEEIDYWKAMSSKWQKNSQDSLKIKYN